MRIVYRIWAVLLPIIASLTACSNPQESAQARPRSKPAHHYVIVDVSTSTATQTDPVVAQGVERTLGDDMAKSVELGDAITVYEAGARGADRMVARLNLVTDYSLRVPVAHAKVVRTLHESAERFRNQGGDNGTNLLLTLESIRPECSPRSTVTLITDGIESSEAASAARALASDQPVSLPPPPGRYLAGCRIRFLGFGLTTDATNKAELLPASQLNALRSGWANYLQAAGVQPDDIEFTSTL